MKRECPYCKAKLELVKFREVGELELDTVVDTFSNEWPYLKADFWCGHCNHKLSFTEIEQLDVV